MVAVMDHNKAMHSRHIKAMKVINNHPIMRKLRDIHHPHHLIIGMEELLLYQQLELLMLVILIITARHHLQLVTSRRQ